MRYFLVLSSLGCLLPFLAIMNLLFGWIFFKFNQWLLIEAILILLAALNSFLATKRIFSRSQKRSNVIDVEGKVVDDKERLE